MELSIPKILVNILKPNTGGSGDLRTIASEQLQVVNDLGWLSAFEFPPKLNQKNA